MPEIVEVAIWICVIALVFVIVTYPMKGTETKSRDDSTIQFVNGKPMLIDKRRWDVEIFRK